MQFGVYVKLQSLILAYSIVIVKHLFMHMKLKKGNYPTD